MANEPEPPDAPEQAPIDKVEAAEQGAQALAKRQAPVRDVLKSEQFRNELRKMLPLTMRPERFVRVVLNAMMKTPELANCTRDSLFLALLNCSGYGLEPDGRRAHLIPYRNKKTQKLECQLQIDYKGLAQLVRQAGDVRHIHCDVVYLGDAWEFEYGSNKHLTHKPDLSKRGKGGVRIAFYSYVRLKDNTEEFMVLSPAEVENVHKRSKSPDAGPWVTDYDEMGKKTAFRRHSKWLPLSEEVRDAIERDNDAIDLTDFEELTPEQEAQLETGGKKKLREMAAAAAKKPPATETEPVEPPEKPPASEV